MLIFNVRIPIVASHSTGAIYNYTLSADYKHTNNMTEDEEGEIDLDELTSEVPWEFVHDFLSLCSILACQASCTVQTEKCNFVSALKCVTLLIRAMKQ